MDENKDDRSKPLRMWAKTNNNNNNNNTPRSSRPLCYPSSTVGCDEGCHNRFRRNPWRHLQMSLAAQISVVEQKLKGTKGNTAMACFLINRMFLRWIQIGTFPLVHHSIPSFHLRFGYTNQKNMKKGFTNRKTSPLESLKMRKLEFIPSPPKKHTQYTQQPAEFPNGNPLNSTHHDLPSPMSSLNKALLRDHGG